MDLFEKLRKRSKPLIIINKRNEKKKNNIKRQEQKNP